MKSIALFHVNFSRSDVKKLSIPTEPAICVTVEIYAPVETSDSGQTAWVLRPREVLTGRLTVTENLEASTAC
jgi:hypothetical protein